MDAAAESRIVATSRGVAWLVEMMLSTGPLRFTTWGSNVTFDGNNYLAFGSLCDVGQLSESEDTSNSKMTLRFSLVDTSVIAMVLTNVDVYRGKEVLMYLQLFDETYQPDGAATLRWKGYMDKASISREPMSGAGEGSKGKIEIQCSRAGMPRSRNKDGLRLTDAQQKAEFPGDRGLEYVTKLIEQPTLWLSRAFQEIK